MAGQKDSRASRHVRIVGEVDPLRRMILVLPPSAEDYQEWVQSEAGRRLGKHLYMDTLKVGAHLEKAYRIPFCVKIEPATPHRYRSSDRRLEPPCWRKSDLHFSPRGETKWVRGPSGRGASRAEEKGACRRSGLIASFGPRLAKHATQPFRFTGRQRFLLEQTKPPPMGFHESRDTKHGLLSRASAVVW